MHISKYSRAHWNAFIWHYYFFCQNMFALYEVDPFMIGWKVVKTTMPIGISDMNLYSGEMSEKEKSQPKIMEFPFLRMVGKTGNIVMHNMCITLNRIKEGSVTYQSKVQWLEELARIDLCPSRLRGSARGSRSSRHSGRYTSTRGRPPGGPPVQLPPPTRWNQTPTALGENMLHHNRFFIEVRTKCKRSAYEVLTRV